MPKPKVTEGKAERNIEVAKTMLAKGSDLAGGLLVIEGETTPGAFFAFFSAFFAAYRP